MKYVALSTFFLLSACSFSTAQSYANVDHNRCIEIGYEKGTQDYRECRKDFYLLRSLNGGLPAVIQSGGAAWAWSR